MRELNSEVDIKKRPAKEVAEEFLIKEGLISWFKFKKEDIENLKGLIGDEKAKSLESLENTEFSENDLIYNLEKLNFNEKEIKTIMDHLK